jgi:hypothetical protein
MAVLVGSVALIAAFLAIELRSRTALLALRLFRVLREPLRGFRSSGGRCHGCV